MLDPTREYVSISSMCGSDIAVQYPVFRRFYEIRVYGKRLNGKSVCIHVQDFRPFLYVGYYAPTPKYREALIHAVEKVVLPRVKSKMSQAVSRGMSLTLIGKSSVRGQQLKLGFETDERSSEFWKFEFDTEWSLDAFRRAWSSAFTSSTGTYGINVLSAINEDWLAAKEKNNTDDRNRTCLLDGLREILVAAGVRPDECVRLFHGQLSPNNIFAHEKDIQPSGWISFPKQLVDDPQYAKSHESVFAFSTQDRDLVIRAENILAVNDNKYLNEEVRVRNVIVSSDIETTGLYAFRTTMSMTQHARDLLAYLKTRMPFGADWTHAKLRDCLLHLFGTQVCMDEFALRCDLIMESSRVTPESVDALLRTPVPTSWYQQLMEICRAENDLSEKQLTLLHAHEERVKELKKSILHRHDATVDGHGDNDGGYGDDDHGGNDDDDDDDDDDAAAAADDTVAAKDLKHARQDLLDAHEAKKLHARTAAATKAAAATELGRAEQVSSGAAFLVSGDESLGDLILRAPPQLFADTSFTAQMLVFMWSRAFGPPSPDRVFDITSCVMCPWEEKPHRTCVFLWIEHFAAHHDVLPDKYRGAEIFWCKTESELICRWSEWLVKEADPDMHVGYNWAAFDCPFLYTRAKLLGPKVLDVFMTQSRVRNLVCSGPRKPNLQQVPDFYKRSFKERQMILDKIAPTLAEKKTKLPNNVFMTEQFIPAEGRIQLDLLIYMKKSRNYPSFTLDYVSSLSIMDSIVALDVDENHGELRVVTKDSFQGLKVDDYVHLQLTNGFFTDNVGPKLKVTRICTDTKTFFLQPPSVRTRFAGLIPYTFREEAQTAAWRARNLIAHPESLRVTDDTMDVVEELDEQEEEERERAVRDNNRVLRNIVQDVQDAKLRDKNMKLRWGLAKDDMGYKEMQNYAKCGALDEVLLVCKYCVRDCELPLVLIKLMNVWLSVQSMSQLAKVPMDLILARGQSIRLLSFMTNLCVNRRVFLADVFHVYEEDSINKKKLKMYEGAIVLTPKTGLYLKQNVNINDFNSLYPSLIMSYNISLMSKAGTLLLDDSGKLLQRYIAPGLQRALQAALSDSSDSDSVRLAQLLLHADTYSLEKDLNVAFRFRSPIDGLQYVVTNLHFDRKQHFAEEYGKKVIKTRMVEKRVGRLVVFYVYRAHFMRRTLPGVSPDAFPMPIIPSMCRQFTDGRAIAKKKQKEATNPFVASIYEIQQKVVKEMNNSIYGQLGFKQGQYCDFDIANSVTAAGRRSLLFTKSLLESSFSHGLRLQVNTRDTDDDVHPHLHRVDVSSFSRADLDRLLQSEEANDRVANCYTHLLETDSFLSLERSALVLARERFSGLFLIENTNGCLAFRNALLHHFFPERNPATPKQERERILELIERRQFHPQHEPMLWIRPIDERTGHVIMPWVKEGYAHGSAALLQELKSVSFSGSEYIYGDTDSVFFKTNKTYHYGGAPPSPATSTAATATATAATATATDTDAITKDTANGASSPLANSGVVLTDFDVRVVEGSFSSLFASVESQFQPPPMNLEFEKIIADLFLVQRKRYAGRKFQDSLSVGKLDTSGLSIKRKDAADWTKTVCVNLLSNVISGMSVAEMIERTRGEIRELTEGRIPIEKLVLSCSLKDSYDQLPENVKQLVLAQRIAADDPANAPKAGDRIPFIYIVPKGLDMLRDRYQIEAMKAGMKIETPERARAMGLQPDYYYYVMRQLYKPMMQFFAHSMREVYAYLGRLEEYETVLLPDIQARMAENTEPDGMLLPKFNKWKEDMCIRLLDELLIPVLYPDARSACMRAASTKTKTKRSSVEDGDGDEDGGSKRKKTAPKISRRPRENVIAKALGKSGSSRSSGRGSPNPTSSLMAWLRGETTTSPIPPLGATACGSPALLLLPPPPTS